MPIGSRSLGRVASISMSIFFFFEVQIPRQSYIAGTENVAHLTCTINANTQDEPMQAARTGKICFNTFNTLEIDKSYKTFRKHAQHIQHSGSAVSLLEHAVVHNLASIRENLLSSHDELKLNKVLHYKPVCHYFDRSPEVAKGGY